MALRALLHRLTETVVKHVNQVRVELGDLRLRKNIRTKWSCLMFGSAESCWLEKNVKHGGQRKCPQRSSVVGRPRGLSQAEHSVGSDAIGRLKKSSSEEEVLAKHDRFLSNP
jgi:hypothetical protein